MLPVQVLLNNFLYDLSEVPIPMDEVDAEEVRRPHRWQIGFIQRFMLAVGPVSSLFDFATFYLLLRVLGANEALFHTGWFVESLATQVLVIFVIRTRGNPLRSRPSPLLAVTALAVVALAVALPFTAFGAGVGFVRPPATFFALLAGLAALYLAAVELVKRLFYWTVADSAS
jgi:Mg2+-importing ATPase